LPLALSLPLALALPLFDCSLQAAPERHL
jgi:hypothetical protein